MVLVNLLKIQQNKEKVRQQMNIMLQLNPLDHKQGECIRISCTMHSSPNLSSQTKSIFSPLFVQFSACYCKTTAKIIILQPYSSLKKGMPLTKKYFFNECLSLFILKILHYNSTYTTISDNVL